MDKQRADAIIKLANAIQSDNPEVQQPLEELVSAAESVKQGVGNQETQLDDESQRAHGVILEFERTTEDNGTRNVYRFSSLTRHPCHVDCPPEERVSGLQNRI